MKADKLKGRRGEDTNRQSSSLDTTLYTTNTIPIHTDTGYNENTAKEKEILFIHYSTPPSFPLLILGVLVLQVLITLEDATDKKKVDMWQFFPFGLFLILHTHIGCLLCSSAASSSSCIGFDYRLGNQLSHKTRCIPHANYPIIIWLTNINANAIIIIRKVSVTL